MAINVLTAVLFRSCERPDVIRAFLCASSETAHSGIHERSEMIFSFCPMNSNRFYILTKNYLYCVIRSAKSSDCQIYQIASGNYA